MTRTTVQALGQDRLGDLHDQARRDALARAARRAQALVAKALANPLPVLTLKPT